MVVTLTVTVAIIVTSLGGVLVSAAAVVVVTLVPVSVVGLVVSRHLPVSLPAYRTNVSSARFRLAHSSSATPWLAAPRRHDSR